jgi:hypothetical protein
MQAANYFFHGSHALTAGNMHLQWRDIVSALIAFLSSIDAQSSRKAHVGRRGRLRMQGCCGPEDRSHARFYARAIRWGARSSARKLTRQIPEDQHDRDNVVTILRIAMSTTDNGLAAMSGRRQRVMVIKLLTRSVHMTAVATSIRPEE